MAEISAKQVKELREMTDAGMMDCKKALVETNGDMDAAVDYLRKKGLSKAAKKADRDACEGQIALHVADDGKSATISEINSETDFVAQNDQFMNFVKSTNGHIHASAVGTVEELNSTTIDGVKFEEYISSNIAKIGENLVVRRFVKVATEGAGAVNGYLHSNGKVGVVVAAKCDSEKTAEGMAEILREVSMHAAAMKPAYLEESQVPEEVVEKEKSIAIELLKKEGKPEAMFEKILPGKIKKYYEDNTLVNQKFVKDDKKTVKQVVSEAAKAAGGTAELIEYVRFELGEGMEKKACDFASEVAAQLQ